MTLKPDDVGTAALEQSTEEDDDEEFADLLELDQLIDSVDTPIVALACSESEDIVGSQTEEPLRNESESFPLLAPMPMKQRPLKNRLLTANL